MAYERHTCLPLKPASWRAKFGVARVARGLRLAHPTERIPVDRISSSQASVLQ